jgi:lipoprotein signal peptidase
VVVFGCGFAGDLLLKAWFVAHDDVYFHVKDGRPWSRLLLSAAAVAVAYGLSRAARWRGYGEVWGVWVGAGLLVAGVLANGVSRVIWERGVPDFIFAGDFIWNPADFMIGVGMTGGIVSLLGTALVAYARGRIHVARP